MSNLVYNKGFIDAISKLFGKDAVLKFIELKDTLNQKVSIISGGTVDNIMSVGADGNAKDSGKAIPSGAVVGTTDTQTLTNKTIKLYGATDNFGTATIADNSGSQADPGAITSTDVATADADATYGTEERDLINETKTVFNLLRADVTAIRTALIGTIDYCDALKTTLNALLAEIRKTNGCGVLHD